ncbi:NAD(P)-dependent oxidoreductase [Facklamia sp. 7083-14-GEN3]|uniref:NAD(P)-dependent oxidoreductase n=1 Tax=Facklamia sp. 7083-14-GEN3 TaxID=2973478 RepID=UPI00215BB718|nr:NAD(P)-dependent oxidoreductase [Facklamia sp. 7083-14-GEN3]MCR8969426.1 NAD(P)-dependent oxidoreductase [Facklamia sp. 7083-14-GEN3]
MKVGFIGLGVMGQSMAGHILKAGYPLYIYNRTKAKANQLVEEGAIWKDSPEEIAQVCDIVLTIVGYPEDVEAVYIGEKGLFKGAHPGQVFIDLTTSRPSLAQELTKKGQDLGVIVLDAPVSGGDLGAKAGRLTAMVGGDDAALDKVRPILETFSASIQHHGSAGSGQHAKASNQIMIAGTMTGMVETLRYAKANGLDLEKVIATLTGGAANNWSLANYGPRILKADYSPGFFVKHYIKDLGIALEEAEKANLDLPGTSLAYDLYQELAKVGYENDGTQALIKLWWDQV